MEVYLIRHGQSVNNALMEDPTQRVQDPPLTEIGWEQAHHTAEFLKTAVNIDALVMYRHDDPKRTDQPHPFTFTHLYCSPMQRAMETAQPISAALSMSPQVWIDIHEIGGIYLERDGVVTGYGGLTRPQMNAMFPGYQLPDQVTDNGWWNPANGQEDMMGCMARAMRIAMQLSRRASDEATKNDKIVLVSHGTLLGALLKTLASGLPGRGFYYWHYNCGITRVDLIDSGETIVRYVNRVTHLPDRLIT